MIVQILLLNHDGTILEKLERGDLLHPKRSSRLLMKMLERMFQAKGEREERE